MGVLTPCSLWLHRCTPVHPEPTSQPGVFAGRWSINRPCVRQHCRSYSIPNTRQTKEYENLDQSWQIDVIKQNPVWYPVWDSLSACVFVCRSAGLHYRTKRVLLDRNMQIGLLGNTSDTETGKWVVIIHRGSIATTNSPLLTWHGTWKMTWIIIV